MCHSISGARCPKQEDGHYKAVCRTGALWLAFNDSNVRKVSAVGMQTNYGCGAYILCYERKSGGLPAAPAKRTQCASPLCFCAVCCEGNKKS